MKRREVLKLSDRKLDNYVKIQGTKFDRKRKFSEATKRKMKRMYKNGKSVKEIHTVTNGQLEIVECEVTSDSKVSGKELKEISNPGTFLVLLDKKSGTDQYQIVNGNTRITAGDHIVLITVAENSKKVLAYFGSGE